MEMVLSVVFRMTQQKKVRQGGPKPCHCSNQRGGIFKCRAQLGSCWDGPRLNLKSQSPILFKIEGTVLWGSRSFSTFDLSYLLGILSYIRLVFKFFLYSSSPINFFLLTLYLFSLVANSVLYSSSPNCAFYFYLLSWHIPGSFQRLL